MMIRFVARTVLAVAMLAASCASAQYFSGGPTDERDVPVPKVGEFRGNGYTHCTLIYDNNGFHERLGYGWSSEWPDAGLNFMTRLSQLTNIAINRDADGKPHQVALRATNPAIFNYPIVVMTDCGTVGFSQEEAASLRKYLLNGGFLLADDFWNEQEWQNWLVEIGKIFPDGEYTPRDIPLDHDIFHIVFDVKEVPQIPCIEFWYRTRGATTSEQGEATKTPHLRGLWDKHGRLMMVMSHNTDLQDGWQQEGQAEEYFREFSVKRSYPISINIIVYAMTH